MSGKFEIKTSNSRGVEETWQYGVKYPDGTVQWANVYGDPRKQDIYVAQINLTVHPNDDSLRRANELFRHQQVASRLPYPHAEYSMVRRRVLIIIGEEEATVNDDNA